MGESPVHNLKIIIYYIKKETMPQDSTKKYADLGNLIASFDANVKIGQVNALVGKQIQMCPSLVMSGHVEQDNECFNSYLTPEQLQQKIQNGEAINAVNMRLKPREILGNNLDNPLSFNNAFYIDDQPGFCFKGFSTGPLALNVTKVVPWGSLNIKINEPDVTKPPTDCDIPSVCQVSTKFNFGCDNSFEIAVGEDSNTCSDILSNSWKMNWVIGKNFEIGLLFIGDDKVGTSRYDKRLRVAAKSDKPSQQFQGVLCYDLNNINDNNWVFHGKSNLEVRQATDNYGARRFKSRLTVDKSSSTPTFTSNLKFEEDISDCVTNYCSLNINQPIEQPKVFPSLLSSGEKYFDCNTFCQLGCIVNYKLSC
jgi:hypothetical protein